MLNMIYSEERNSWEVVDEDTSEWIYEGSYEQCADMVNAHNAAALTEDAMSNADKILDDWSKFCQEQENCEKCQYGNEGHCATAYAYDAGIKHAFDTAVNLLEAYQKEGRHD